jgi:hypothetical protein
MIVAEIPPPMYEVEAIIGINITEEGVVLLVKWVRYPDPTWELAPPVIEGAPIRFMESGLRPLVV